MISLQQTRDGSPTLYSSMYDSSYHSMNGALSESRHVYIQNGLIEYLDEQDVKKEISVLEMGLGSGLNAYLTAEYAIEHHQALNYTAIEKHPLPSDAWKRYAGDEGFVNLAHRNIYHSIIDAQWNQDIKLHPYFSLRKCHIDFLHFTSNNLYDVLYYDAFDPGTQAELWDLNACRKIFKLLKTGGIMTTYCAQGQFKRNLKKVGFRVNTLEGAPGKREMVQAIK